MMEMINDDIRCGTERPSMKTNCLIDKPDIGQVKKMTFLNHGENQIFGIKNDWTQEGAKEVISSWKEHIPNRNRTPQPDLVSMNKLATSKGIIEPKAIREFYKENKIYPAVQKKCCQHNLKKENKEIIYGMPSQHRSAEQVKFAGEFEPKIRNVVQGRYQNDWIKMHKEKNEDLNKVKTKLKISQTKASKGHMDGAKLHQKIWSEEKNEKLFKMKQFLNVSPKIIFYNKSLEKKSYQDYNKDSN